MEKHRKIPSASTRLWWTMAIFCTVPIIVATSVYVWNGVFPAVILFIGLALLSLFFNRFLGHGLLSLFSNGWDLESLSDLESRWEARKLDAEGVVTEGRITYKWFERQHDGRTTDYWDEFFVTCTFGDNCNIDIRQEVSSSLYEKFQIGDKVDIQYLPSDPRVARLVTESSKAKRASKIKTSQSSKGGPSSNDTRKTVWKFGQTPATTSDINEESGEPTSEAKSPDYGLWEAVQEERRESRRRSYKKKKETGENSSEGIQPKKKGKQARKNWGRRKKKP